MVISGIEAPKVQKVSQPKKEFIAELEGLGFVRLTKNDKPVNGWQHPKVKNIFVLCYAEQFEVRWFALEAEHYTHKKLPYKKGVTWFNLIKD